MISAPGAYKPVGQLPGKRIFRTDVLYTAFIDKTGPSSTDMKEYRLRSLTCSKKLIDHQIPDTKTIVLLVAFIQFTGVYLQYCVWKLSLGRTGDLNAPAGAHALFLYHIRMDHTPVLLPVSLYSDFFPGMASVVHGASVPCQDQDSPDKHHQVI